MTTAKKQGAGEMVHAEAAVASLRFAVNAVRVEFC